MNNTSCKTCPSPPSKADCYAKVGCYTDCRKPLIVKFIEAILILTWITLLILAIVFVGNNHLADNENSSLFKRADRWFNKNTVEHASEIASGVGYDGFWGLAYISASIITFLGLYFLLIPVTVYNFGLLFLLIFFFTYAILAFFIHHSIIPTVTYLRHYIDKRERICRNITKDEDDDQDDEESVE